MDILRDVKWKPIPMDGVPDAEKYATHTGSIKMAGFVFRCYQLNTGERLIDADDVEAFFLGMESEAQGGE